MNIMQDICNLRIVTWHIYGRLLPLLYCCWCAQQRVRCNLLVSILSTVSLEILEA